MGDRLLDQISLNKTQEKFKEKQDFQVEGENNSYVIKENENINQNQVKQPQDIFKKEEMKPGAFDDFINESENLSVKKIATSGVIYRSGTFDHLVRTRAEEKLLDKDAQKQLKKEREKLAKEMDHSESDIFSLLDKLENNPFKVYEWMKASAILKGASESFKTLIDAYGKMLNSPEEALNTAGIEVANAAKAYLDSHSDKPVHNYGKQRVLICKDITENINALTTIIAWQRQMLKDPSANMKEDFDNIKEKELKDFRDINKTSIDELSRALEESIKDFSEEEKDLIRKETRNITPIVKTDDIEWNKVWISTYMRQKELLGKNDRNEDENKELEALKHQRRPFLDEVVNEIMSITEEDINRLINEPEFYKKNANIFDRVGALQYLSDSKGQSTVDAEYFDNMPSAYKDKFLARCDVIYIAMDIVGQARAFASGVSGKDLNNISSERKLSNFKERFKTYESLKKNAFSYKGVEEAKKIWDNGIDDPTSRLYKNATVEFLDTRFAKGSEKRARTEAENVYKKMNAFIDKYKKDEFFGVPSLEESRNIMLTGSLEDRLALLLVFQRLDVVSTEKTKNSKQYGLVREYESIYYTLSHSLLDTHPEPDAQSDLLGLNIEDSKKLGLIMASYHQMSYENLFKKYDRDIRALEKSYTPEMTKEEYEKKKKEIVRDYMNSRDAQLVMAFDEFGSTGGSDGLASYVYRLARQYYGEMDTFSLSNILESKYRPEYMSGGQMSDEDFEKAVEKGQELGYISREENAQYNFVNRPHEDRVEDDFKYREQEAYHIIFKEDKKDSLLKDDKVNVNVTRDKKKDDAAKKKANKLMDEKNGKGAEKYKIATRFTEDSIKVSEELADSGRTLRHYTKQVDPVNATNRDHNYILYYLWTETTKSTEGLSRKEKERIEKIPAWNQKLTENYLAVMDGDKIARQRLHNQMFERLDEIMRFEITKENILDVNWVIKNFARLEEYSNICGNFTNIEHGDTVDSFGAKEYVDAVKALPHYETLNGKMNVLSSMGSLLKVLRGGIGLNDKQSQDDPTGYYLSKFEEEKLDDASVGMGLTFEEGYNQLIQNVLYDYEKYSKIRDKYIKPTNNGNA